MTSIQSKLQPIGTALAAIVPNTYHYWRPNMKPPYLLWAEDGENGLSGDDAKLEQGIKGRADYYTKTEFDANIDSIQTCFNTLGLSWRLNSVFFEETTNLIHYSWDWEAL